MHVCSLSLLWTRCHLWVISRCIQCHLFAHFTNCKLFEIAMKIDAFFSFSEFSTIASRNLHIENLSTRKLHRANGKRENEGGSERTQQAQMGVWYRKRGVCDFDNCTWEGQGIRTVANHRRRANQLSVKKWWWLWRFSLWVERNCWRNWGTVKEREGERERGEKK